MSRGESHESSERFRSEAAEWFARLRGPHTERDLAAFDAWREGHAERQSAYDRLLRRWDQTAFLRHSDVGRRRNLEVVFHGARRSPRRALAATIAALAVISLAGLFVTQRSQAHSFHYVNPVGKVREIDLADGSRLTLDTDSVVDARFSPASRDLILSRGRARFEVAHGDSRPFIVRAAGSIITAGNSSFGVAIDEGNVDVMLLRGIAEVDSPSLGSTSPVVRRHLASGEQLMSAARQSLPRPVPIDLASLQWASGSLSFEDTELGEAARQLNRYSGSKLIVDDADITNLRVTGVFHSTDNFAFARAVAAIFRLAVERDGYGNIHLLAAAEHPRPAQK
jgi:transmembrane sensor